MNLESFEGTIWINARVLAVNIPINKEQALKFVPPEIKLESIPTATIFIAHYPQTTFGSVYNEAAVLLHCRDQQGEFRYCPWMVVDDDTALILGRELLGFPKKLADIKLEESGSSVVGTVNRKGTELIRIEGEVEQQIESVESIFGYRIVNVFGSIIGGMKLLEIPASIEKFKSASKLAVKVTLNSSLRDPLGALSPPTTAKGTLVTVDFGGNGTIPVLGKDVDANWSLTNFFARAN
jgi:acetoacetate decarboxylase